MARRDTTSFRQVTNVTAPQVAAEQEAYVPSTANQMLNVAADIGSQIIKAGEEAKITERYSQAQLELNQTQQQYEIDYEGNPFEGMKKLKDERQKIFDKYGSDISPFFKKTWNDNVRELGFKNEAQGQAWAYKQTRTNTVTALNNSMKNNLSQALIDGQNFGNSDETEFGALVNYADSKSKLIEFGDKNLGSETTTDMLENYDDDYLKTVISGVSDVNPVKALKMLDDPKIQKSFRNPEHFMEMKKAVEARAENSNKITGEKQVLQVLKNENSILAKSLQTPISYAALKAEFDKSPAMSNAAKSYFLRANGYTKEDGTLKLDSAEQYKFKEELYSQIQATTIKKDFSANDVSALQDKIYQGMTNKALTDAEGARFLTDLVNPLADKKEASMQNFGSYGYPFYTGDDLGFSNIQKMYDESIAIPIVTKEDGTPLVGSAGAQVENARNKIKLMDYYRDALQSEASKQSGTGPFRYGDIPNLPTSQARKIYGNAAIEAKRLYMQEKYPELSSDEPLPNSVIPTDGGRIYTGAQAGKKADASVSADFQIMEDAKGNRARVYKDGRIEELP